jgi:hypothetical protein
MNNLDNGAVPEWKQEGFASQEEYDEYDAREWRDSCAAMKAAEARWVDNGCSNHYDEPEDQRTFY